MRIKYEKRGRPFESLLEQVLENESLTLDRICNNQRYDEEKFVILFTWNWHEFQWNSWQHRSANWSSCHYSHRGSCPNITSNSNLLSHIYICRASVWVQQSCWNLLKERLIGCHRRQYAEQAVTTSPTSGKWISLVQFMFFSNSGFVLCVSVLVLVFVFCISLTFRLSQL